MNHLLRLRHYRYFLRKMYAYSFKCNYSVDCLKQIRTENMYVIDSRYVPVQNSFQQIREFAKKAQGKIPRGGKAKKMQLNDEEMAEVIDVNDFRQQLNNVAEKLKREYADNLSIRSAVGNVENIMVKINEEEYPLNELAVISKKNPTLVAINMKEFPEGLKPAIRAIIESGSGFNPQQDGTMIYLNIPKMTREHRENLAKNAKTLLIKSKDEIRSIQNAFIRDAKDKTECSEDLVFNVTSQIKVMADQFASDLEKILKAKQKELLGDS